MSEVKSFTDLYQKSVSPNELLATFLCGHLSVEFMLHKLACMSDTANQARCKKCTHYQLINVNYELGNIAENQKQVLLDINRLRNKFAHELGYVPTVKTLRVIYGSALTAFSDLTDGIYQGLESLKGLNDLEKFEQWDMSELFVQICYDLHEQYQVAGGDIELF